MLPLAADQVGLLVAFGDDAIESSRWIDGTQTATIEVSGAKTVAFFRFEQTDFSYHGDGAWRAHLPAISLDDGACHRCYASNETSPQPGYPGEICPFPTFVEPATFRISGAEVIDDPVLAADVHAKLRLEWPGAGPRGCFRIGVIGVEGVSADAVNVYFAENSARYTRLSPDTELNAATLSAFDVILLELPGRAYTSTEAAALHAWVSEGGGLVALSGFADTGGSGRSNRLLEPFEIEYYGELHDGTVSLLDHPTTHGLTAPIVVGTLSIRTTTVTSPFVPVAKIVSENLGMVAQIGRGRAFIWGDEIALADQAFTQAFSEAHLFWSNVLEWVEPDAPLVLSP